MEFWAFFYAHSTLDDLRNPYSRLLIPDTSTVKGHMMYQHHMVFHTANKKKNIDKKNKHLSWDNSKLYCFVNVIEGLLPQGAREVKP